MIELKIDDEIFFATIGDDDNSLTIATKSKGFLEFSGNHTQECCEDVAFDFDEIPIEQLQQLKGLFITDVIVGANQDGGVLIRFVTNEPDSMFPDEFVSHAILVGCHNIQNGYYSDKLDMDVYWDGQVLSESVIGFTRE
jgi:hypothetical protein